MSSRFCQPTYCSDLSQCDFWLFPKLKLYLKNTMETADDFESGRNAEISASFTKTAVVDVQNFQRFYNLSFQLLVHPRESVISVLFEKR